jgi:hypothetical protein
MNLEKGNTLTVQENFSITKKSCQVTIVEFNDQDLSCLVRYNTGYEEWLPISAFEGY